MTVLQSALNDVLLAMMNDSQELVQHWWNTPNEVFEMSCPKDVDLFRVRDYVMWRAMGVM